MKKINWKQGKYTLPLIALPFVMIIVWSIYPFFEDKPIVESELKTSKGAISTELGDVEGSEIKNKTEAYQQYYNTKTDGRSRIDNFSDESLTEKEFKEMSDAEKRTIDSIKVTKKLKELDSIKTSAEQDREYYKLEKAEKVKEDRKREDLEYDRSMKMLEMLNGGGKNNDNNNETQESNSAPKKKEPSVQQQQMSLMREQMMLMDSLEKANNPDLVKQAKANEILKKKQDDLDMYLNSSLRVKKVTKDADFNSVYKETKGVFIKAVIDQDIKGYLGSRLRLRLLEDIYVGTLRIKKGTFLYALINGFGLQRVTLSVVSVMYENEILPINLSIYDLDGMEGLYVPSSSFREMTREMGESLVQGTTMSNSSQDFLASAMTNVYQSTSTTISKLIRTNKVNLKYNSFIYLIDKEELNQSRDNIYNSNKR